MKIKILFNFLMLYFFIKSIVLLMKNNEKNFHFIFKYHAINNDISESIISLLLLKMRIQALFFLNFLKRNQLFVVFYNDFEISNNHFHF